MDKPFADLEHHENSSEELPNSSETPSTIVTRRVLINDHANAPQNNNMQPWWIIRLIRWLVSMISESMSCVSWDIHQ